MFRASQLRPLDRNAALALGGTFRHTGAREPAFAGWKTGIVGNRVIEIIAGVAAVVFIAAMVWSDFARDPEPRWERVRPIQYACALIVLVCVIVLGVRD